MPQPDWKPFGGLLQQPLRCVRRLLNARQSSLAVNHHCMRRARHPSAGVPLKRGLDGISKAPSPPAEQLVCHSSQKLWCKVLCSPASPLGTRLWSPLPRAAWLRTGWVDRLGRYGLLLQRQTGCGGIHRPTLQHLMTYKWDALGFLGKKKKNVWREKKINLIASALGKKAKSGSVPFPQAALRNPSPNFRTIPLFFHHTGHKSHWSVVWLQELTMLWGSIDGAHFFQEECDGLISIEGYWRAGEPHYKWSRQYFMSEHPFIVSASVCGTYLSKKIKRGQYFLKKQLKHQTIIWVDLSELLKSVLVQEHELDSSFLLWRGVLEIRFWTARCEYT